MYIRVDTTQQKLTLINNGDILLSFSISTGKNGTGSQAGSECTPKGWHVVREMIGKDEPENRVFEGRRPIDLICNEKTFAEHPGRDWILTRILWLSGLDDDKNRFHPVDTHRRFIYIHGTPDWTPLGVPGSRGCIRMKNKALIALYTKIIPGTRVYIN